MKKLNEILGSLPIDTIVKGDANVEINDLHLDSRQVGPNDAFIAIKGSALDGHNYISKAIDNGSIVIFCQKEPILLSTKVTYVICKEIHENLRQLSVDFYGNPSTKLKLVGVTGTNGKTTIATMFYRLMRSMNQTAGLISTVDIRINDSVLPTKLTTPDVVSLNRILSLMVDDKCEFVMMEVSSHAIHQGRIDGLNFVGGVFTNITHDHLDYHKTFREYLNTKKMFFDLLDKNSFAITNLSDKNGMVMVQNTKAKVITYGLKVMADYNAKIFEHDFSGLHLQIDGIDFYSKLIGDFNVLNLLAVYSTAIQFGFEKVEVLTHLSLIDTAPGRFEIIRKQGVKNIGIVDYAHTPDALLNVATTIQNINKGERNVTIVVGCGGDRDKAKRPIMAKIAAQHSTTTILTNDNPRTEDPDQILDDMEQGITPDLEPRVLRIPDRQQAIKTAIKMSQNGIILVAGKGHENYQEINGKRFPFDDKEMLQNYL